MKAAFLIFLLGFTHAKTWEMVVRRAIPYESAMIASGKKHGVDPRLLWVIGYNETKFIPTLKSPVGALGMMQFMPATAVRFGLRDPFDPVASIEASARYLSVLQKEFPGRPDLMLAAYNAGEVAVQAYLEGRTIVLKNGKVINRAAKKTNGVPPYEETVNYVRQGMAILGMLRLPDEKATSIEKSDVAPVEESESPTPPTRTIRSSIYLYGDDEAVKPKKGSSVILYPS